MYTLAQLEQLTIGNLSLERQIEASASVQGYLETYAEHKIDPPTWLTDLRQTIRGVLRDAQKEQDISAVEGAQRRAWNRLPPFEREQTIRAKIAALEAELGP